MEAGAIDITEQATKIGALHEGKYLTFSLEKALASLSLKSRSAADEMNAQDEYIKALQRNWSAWWVGRERETGWSLREVPPGRLNQIQGPPFHAT